MFAINMETGGELWSSNVSSNGTGPDSACVLALDGIVISATRPDPRGGNLAVVAVNSANGHLVWLFELSVPVYNFQAASPGDDTIVFMTRDGRLPTRP